MTQDHVKTTEVDTVDFAGARQYTKAARQAIFQNYRNLVGEKQSVQFDVACTWMREIANDEENDTAERAREMLRAAEKCRMLVVREARTLTMIKVRTVVVKARVVVRNSRTKMP
jgi:hypothetical protein